MNRLKTVLLLGILTGLIVAIGYYVGGQHGALLALGISALMNLGSYWYSDKLVLLMYRAQPADRAKHAILFKIVEELSRKAGTPVPRLYIVPMAIPNAFATGRNAEHAVVAVTLGILNILDERELRAVIAHEISHVTNHDILISSIAATLAGAISYLVHFAYIAGRRNDRSNGVGPILFIILTPILATLIQLSISRSREFLADSSGAHLSGDPLSLAKALRKLHSTSQAHPLASEPQYETTAHLFIINPFRASFLMKLFSTHPPVEERIRRLESGEAANE